MVAAAERLLRDRPFEDVAVADICRLASVTTGAFYARFASKDALMPLLYERYESWLLSAALPRFDDVDWKRLSPQGAARRITRIVVDLVQERPWLLRAVTLFARARPRELPVADERAGSVLVRRIVSEMSRHVRPGAEPAIQFATFALITAAREAVLFSGLPVAGAGLRTPTLERDLARLFIGYLWAAGALVDKGSATT